MINNISASTTIMERVVDGGQVVILGLAIVFAVLAILWGVLALFKVFFYDIPERRKNGKAPEKKKTKSKENSLPTQPSNDELIAVLTAAVTAYQNSDEIVAVITAAVSAYRQAEGENGEFRVVSFKRANTRAWNRK